MSKKKPRYQNRNQSVPEGTNGRVKKLRFYEQGIWPTISFFAALVFLCLNLAEKGYTFYEKSIGPKFEYNIKYADIAIAKSEIPPNEMKTFLLIRGDAFNTGKKVLRVREYLIHIKVDGVWVPMKCEFPINPITIADPTDPKIFRTIKPAELEYLVEQSQILPDESKSGWIFATVPFDVVPVYYFAQYPSHDIKIICVTTNGEKLTYHFKMYLRAHTEVNPGYY